MANMLSLKTQMKETKKAIVLMFLLINIQAQAQVGFGIRGGFQQSIPLVMRDSFSGKPAISGCINFYLPINTKLNFVAGIGYREVALSYKKESSSINWETVDLNIGTEWINPKFTNSSFYTGINANYIYTFSKTVLSATSSSGTGYATLKSNQKLVPSIEAGIIFKPRPNLTLNISTIQPIPQSKSIGKPTLPGTLSFGIEYRLTTKDIKNWNNDTTATPEKVFTKNLKAGTLYFIEDGTDSSIHVLHKMIAENYNFSKVDFIKASNLSKSLDSFSNLPNANQIFIAKIGAIVYDINRASTQGLIVYDYKMQNQMPDSPFFVRNLSGDSFFEDPIVVRKMIRTLNKRLLKL